MQVENILPGITLNAAQKKVVLSESDCIKVLAGAGTGKTTTILAKVKYLIYEKGVNPKRILVTSFSNAVVRHLEKLLGAGRENCRVTTFHSLGNHICGGTSALLKDPDEILSAYLKGENLIARFPEKNFLQIKRLLETTDARSMLGKYCSRFRSAGFTANELPAIIKGCKNKQEKGFLALCMDYLSYYEEQKAKTNQIDYDDMIIKATKVLTQDADFCRNNRAYAYEYIFVDEYQDISAVRHNFLKILCERTGAKLTVVGDDWQSIYKFSGSELEYFVDFEEKIKPVFSKTEVICLDETRRNGQALIDVAGAFVMTNDRQEKKHLRSLSQSQCDTPIIIFEYDVSSENAYLGSEKEMEEKKDLWGNIKPLIDTLPGTVGILGRYAFPGSTLDRTARTARERGEAEDRITFITIHSAKGLEFDNVILVDCRSGNHGFPSEKKEHAWFSTLEPPCKETVKFPEERRLFYVALTRTKNKVYIYTPTYQKSEFIKELLHIGKSMKKAGHKNPLISEKVMLNTVSRARLN